MDFNDEIDEIAQFFIETSFTLRWGEIEMFHQIGKRIQEIIQKYNIDKEIVFDLLQKITGKRRQRWILALLLYQKYPNLDEAPFDKAITLGKIRRELIPELKRERTTLNKILEQELKKYEQPKNDYEKGRKDEVLELLNKKEKEKDIHNPE